MYSMNMMMSSLLQRFKGRVHFHWRKTYTKHNKIPVISHISAFVTLIPYLFGIYMAFGTRPSLYELFKFFNIIDIFYLLREIIPDFSSLISERIYSKTRAYKWMYKLWPPLSSYGWSWYANIFFRKMGLMFFTHLNISIAMAFIRDT